MAEQEIHAVARSADTLRHALADLREESQGVGRAIGAELAQAGKPIQALADGIGNAVSKAFARATLDGRKFSAVLRGLGNEIASLALQSSLNPLRDFISASVSGLFVQGTAPVEPQAQGAAFSSGRVRAFARGGVVSNAAFFPMRKGVGLMGEAGPEAILPLSRGADGRLGVSLQNGGAGGGPGGATVVVNIATPDPGSFRQSQGQISALLARAVLRARKRL